MIDRIPRVYPRTPIQNQYMVDDHRFSIVAAGRRSRKTLIGVRKVLYRAMLNKGQKFFLGAPTHQQAKMIFWLSEFTGMTRILPAALVMQRSDSDLWIRLPNMSEIHVVGLDKPQRIEGQPWHGCLITEFADLKPTAWGANIRPLLSDTNGFAILDGVPEGRNHYFNHALYASGGAIPQTLPQVGAYAENPNDPDWCFYSWYSADVLTPEEIEAVKRELDERTFRQEYEGSFEGEEGRAYYAFNHANIIPDAPAPKTEIVHIGMDFNVDPMTAVLCDVQGDTVTQFDEIYLRHSNTYEMADHIIHSKGIDPSRCIIYPDATGGAESSNATQSDLKILKQKGFKVRAHEANPRQRDRIAAVNTRCRATDGRVRYFVQRHCVKTINDLNRVQCLPDGRLDKTQEAENLTHVSDALGYLIAFLFPVGKRDRFKLLQEAQTFY